MKINIQEWRSMSKEDRVEMIQQHVTKTFKGGEGK